jgi:hypothetical protein
MALLARGGLARRPTLVVAQPLPVIDWDAPGVRTPVWALRGATTGQLMTYAGQVLVAESAQDWDWLVAGATPVRLDHPERQGPCVWVYAHPDLTGTRWPSGRTGT